MSDWKNKDRIRAAKKALLAYTNAKREKFEDGGTEAQDLVSDLLHYLAATEGGEGASARFRMAWNNFEAEHGNPEEE